METPPLTQRMLEFNIKVMEEELKKLGLKVNHHEENIRFLKSEINTIEQSIADLGIKLGKGAAIANNDASVQEAELRVIQSILNQDKTAASLVCKLRQYEQTPKSSMMKDVLGVVATLGKVNNDNLSSLLSEYLGIDNMLGLVCKTYNCIKALEIYDNRGIVDKKEGIHRLGESIGKSLDGRFTVFCLENIRPFSGEVMIDDPQRHLILHKPRLPSGKAPPGFLGFAVNMIHVDQAYLSYLTPNGHGLRETLFYSLFSHLQVYETTADLQSAIPLINHGAISLEGSILRPNGSFCLGDRKNVEVKFTVTASLWDSRAHGSITEMEEQVKLKNWEKERLVEDMKREEELLKHVKDLFGNQKQQLMDYHFTPPPVAKRVQVSSTIHSPATPGSNSFAASPGRSPFAASPRSNPFSATPGNISFAAKPPHLR
uniref:Uncharacterized protein n=1 Tax=Avena sativa TaxID=4498 RepID=A0ACD5VNT4_AVESA